jgi:hypothetical protein
VERSARRKPRLAYFKLKEALRCEGQFGRLSPKQRDDQSGRLFSILKRTAVFSVTVSVAWESLKIPLQLFPKILTPYQLLVVGLMGRVNSELTRMKLSPRIMFVFDDHKEGSNAETKQQAKNHFPTKKFFSVKTGVLLPRS